MPSKTMGGKAAVWRSSHPQVPVRLQKCNDEPVNARPRRLTELRKTSPDERNVTDSGKAVFLSYASQDASAAERVCDALRSAGVEV